MEKQFTQEWLDARSTQDLITLHVQVLKGDEDKTLKTQVAREIFSRTGKRAAK